MHTPFGMFTYSISLLNFENWHQNQTSLLTTTVWGIRYVLDHRQKQTVCVAWNSNWFYFNHGNTHTHIRRIKQMWTDSAAIVQWKSLITMKEYRMIGRTDNGHVYAMSMLVYARWMLTLRCFCSLLFISHAYVIRMRCVTLNKLYVLRNWQKIAFNRIYFKNPFENGAIVSGVSHL